MFVGATVISLSGRALPVRIHDIACTGHEVKLIDCPHQEGEISCPGCNSTGVHCSYDTARKYHGHIHHSLIVPDPFPAENIGIGANYIG